MRSLRKSWVLAAIALISIVATPCFSSRQKGVKPKSVEKVANKPRLAVETGHADSVISVAFSPDNKTLASGSGDRTVKLWDVATGAEIRTLRGHLASVVSVAFSPDGKRLASADLDRYSGMGVSDATIRLWDVATGVEIRTLKGHSSGPVVFSPDGKLLASGTDYNKITLWEVATGKPIRKLTGHSREVLSIAFSPNGKLLASGSGSFYPTIKLWNVATGAEIRAFERVSGPVLSIAFSPDGKMLASGSEGVNQTLKLWNVKTGAPIRRLKNYSDSIFFVAFYSDGNKLVTGGKGYMRESDDTIKLGDLVTGAEIRTLKDHAWYIRSVAISPDGKLLASSGMNSFDYTIKLWDVATGNKIRAFKEAPRLVTPVAFALDGRTLVFKSLPSPDAVFSPDGKILAAWSQAGDHLAKKGSSGIKLWDVATNTELRTLTGDASSVSSIAFSSDGKMMASGGGVFDHTIKLWDVVTGNEIRSLKGRAICVAFSPDGKTVATGGYDGSTRTYGATFDTIKLWDIATSKEKRTLKRHSGEIRSVAFSPDGKTLASSGDDTIKLWNVAKGNEIRNLTTSERIPVFGMISRNASSIIFSPDGKTLASWGRLDHNIKLWAVVTGAERLTLTGHTQEVFSVAFSPDGKMLASASSDHTIKLWDAVTGKELASLVLLDESGWVITTPDGRFDTNRIDNIKDLHWLMPDAPLTPLPLEIFMRDYYEPKLLPRLLAREPFKSVRDFSTLNRAQPEVKIVDIAPDSIETVQVTVEVASLKNEAQKDAAGKPLESGAYDVRLFRDQQLVGYAPARDGAVILNADGKATLTFSHIKWPRTGQTQVEFSAYAFNADRIKSATDRKIYALTPKPTPVKGRAYVISLGVNAYQRETLNLRYAANDARQMQESLPVRLSTQGEYEELVSLSLISDYEVILADGRTLAAQDATIQQVRAGRNRITENCATKAHLRAVLDVLAGRQADAAVLKEIPNADKLRPARPEDLVLLSVSSHGYTDSNGIFYLVPSDSGTASLSSPEFRSHCVSSDELSQWLRDVDAGDLVMIVDACHSAAAVEGTDFKPGPMGSRGLGQLSYDKGMRILTATQADNVALEANQVRQGLLIYALLHEGLGAWLADYKPRDKAIMLTEWLGYGVERVPRLYEEVKAGQVQVSHTETKPTAAAQVNRDLIDPRELENVKTQEPSLFDFARQRRKVLLARQQ